MAPAGDEESPPQAKLALLAANASANTRAALEAACAALGIPHMFLCRLESSHVALEL